MEKYRGELFRKSRDFSLFLVLLLQEIFPEFLMFVFLWQGNNLETLFCILVSLKITSLYQILNSSAFHESLDYIRIVGQTSFFSKENLSLHLLQLEQEAYFSSNCLFYFYCVTVQPSVYSIPMLVGHRIGGVHA